MFIYFSPQFGGKAKASDIARYTQSDNYDDGKFRNSIETNMDMPLHDIWTLLKEYIKGNTESKPETLLPVIKSNELPSTDSLVKVMWFGHSAFWLQINGKNILLDPMFGDTPSPHPLVGTSRFSDGLPIEIANLPAIDAIFFSHDHYDHLDYGSVSKLKDKTTKFFVPLGLKPHLVSWGVNETAIIEMDWWEETSDMGLEIACTPARHFSGRAFLDRFSTLWCSWTIKSNGTSIFFSGDSGYTPQFQEIGEKFGPFDFAMIECGQYNRRWSNIHMMPEETAQVAIDIKARVFMPIHWGSFKLALHDWDDPVKRVTAEAKNLNIPIVTPKMGEIVHITDSLPNTDNDWWKSL
ncbi:MAG: MBL fold metallo-hydrolase [Candidatus Kapaibacteriales bacterium]